VETSPRNRLGLQGIGYLCDMSHHCFFVSLPWRQIHVTSFETAQLTVKPNIPSIHPSTAHPTCTCLPTSTPLDNTEAKTGNKKPHMQTDSTTQQRRLLLPETCIHTTYHCQQHIPLLSLSPNTNLDDTSSNHANVRRMRSISLVLACLQHTSDADITAY
jgi:hypothetical protein